ncbi:mCG1041086, partial [Mus musculus]
TTNQRVHMEGPSGSSCICSRGLPSRSSMGGKALGPVKVLCLSIGECRGQEAGVGGLGNRGRGEMVGDFWRGN